MTQLIFKGDKETLRVRLGILIHRIKGCDMNALVETLLNETKDILIKIDDFVEDNFIEKLEGGKQ